MFKKAAQLKHKKRTFFFAGHCMSQQQKARRVDTFALRETHSAHTNSLLHSL